MNRRVFLGALTAVCALTFSTPLSILEEITVDITNHVDVLARTLFGECRGEPEIGQIAVAWVVKNRAARPSWWGKTVAGVCLAPWQFSCWLPEDHDEGQRERLEALDDSNPIYVQLRALAQKVIDGTVPDPTHGATHYKVHGTKASWDHAIASLTPVRIGHHDFYRLGPTA